jgi:hypothetical protein
MIETSQRQSNSSNILGSMLQTQVSATGYSSSTSSSRRKTGQEGDRRDVLWYWLQMNSSHDIARSCNQGQDWQKHPQQQRGRQ